MGSNVDPAENLPRALALLAGRVEVLAVSRVFETPAVGPSGSPDFLNAALRCKTALEPLELREGVLREVESELGRRRSGDRFSPRTLDLDISLFGDRVVRDPEHGIEIPDPEILECSHVVQPLADLSPRLEHPVTGEPLSEVAARLGGSFQERRLDGWGVP